MLMKNILKKFDRALFSTDYAGVESSTQTLRQISS